MTTPFLARRPTADADCITSDLSVVSDQLQVMRNQEETTYAPISDKLSTDMNPDDQQHHYRRLMCQWCYQVVDSSRCQRETVSIAFAILDRYLSTRQDRPCDRRSYQLASMTALYIAVKINETSVITIPFLERLSQYVYTKEDFENMEIEIITALGCRLNRPTPLAFLRCFMALIPAPADDKAVIKEIMDSARYQIELAVSDSSFVNYLPSEIAIAALVNVIMDVPDNILSEEMKFDYIVAVEKFSGSSVDSTVPTQSGLQSLMRGEKVCCMTERDCNSNCIQKVLSRPDSPVSVVRKVLSYMHILD